jgi:hypothetical protein
MELGSPPLAPTIPHAELRQLEAAIEALLDELGRARRAHEDAFECIAPARFTGATGDEVRWHVAGQLRRGRALEEQLDDDLRHVRRLRAQAMVLDDRHQEALAEWQRRRTEWRASLLARGDGPIRPPGTDPLARFQPAVMP